MQEKQQPEATDVEQGDDESASGVQVRRWIVHFGKDYVGYVLCLDEHGLTHQYESLTFGRQTRREAVT